MQNVKYEIGKPSNTPVLLPIRGSLTDYLIIPREGIKENGGFGRMDTLYADNKNFRDGTPKVSGVHTNMKFCATLGYPDLFDLMFIDVHVAKFSNPSDVSVVLRSLAFEMIFGGQTLYVGFAGSDLRPYLYLDLEINKEQENKPRHEQYETAREYFDQRLKEHVDRGGLWLWYQIDVRDKNGRPRRIESTESFRLDVKQAPFAKPLDGEVHLKTLLTGVHYKLGYSR